MSEAQPKLEIHLSAEVQADAHQLFDLLVGVVALLQHPHRGPAVEAARGAALEARAVAERVAMHLDALVVIQHEAARAELATKGGR